MDFLQRGLPGHGLALIILSPKGCCRSVAVIALGSNRLPVLHRVKKVNRRVLCLAERLAAAASDARDGALRGIIACGRVILANILGDERQGGGLQSVELDQISEPDYVTGKVL